MKISKVPLVAILAATVSVAPAFAQTATVSAPQTPAAPTPPPEIEIGKIAPDFTIRVADSSGVAAKPVKLSDYRGKVVVLAFYPADRSSGCTHQLTKFRDEYAKLFGTGTVVLPISVDSLSTHASWAAEMKFPFALGADTDLSLAKQYGSWAPGRTNSTRTVFVIGKDGTILYRNLRFLALNESHYSDLAAEVARAR